MSNEQPKDKYLKYEQLTSTESICSPLFEQDGIMDADIVIDGYTGTDSSLRAHL